MLPLKGITVVDFSIFFPGPYSTRLLSDLGARVIKIERTVGGDPQRNWEGTFCVLNADKEGIAIDLTLIEGREIAWRLISQADILVESFQPGITTKLGIDYDTVINLKKDIIYCSITGFGQTGPLYSQPAHNLTALAEAGVLGMRWTGTDPPADMASICVADLSAAMFTVVSIMGALLEKTKNGKGSYIDISMSDCCVSWLSGLWAQHNIGHTIKEIFNYPAYEVFEAKGGDYLAIAALTDKHWLALCRALGFQDFIEDPNFATPQARLQAVNEINKRIAEKIITREREHWLDLLSRFGIPANPVTLLEELARHPHFIERGLLNHVDKSLPAAGVAFPALVNRERWGKERSSAPGLGKDTKRIMKSLGYSDGEIEKLSKNGIIRVER